ncbi:MAG: preprotein translocase subunit SecA [Micavibrio sp.]|nr:preprotein translocase subunit SecA [Micavibrio sp.]
MAKTRQNLRFSSGITVIYSPESIDAAGFKTYIRHSHNIARNPAQKTKDFMLLALAQKIFGTSNERSLKAVNRHIAPINALEPKYAEMTDAELRKMTDVFRKQLAEGATLDDILHDAFAVVREAARRTLGLRAFDVQLIGGITLHQGKIAEMKTGEGKTLVGTLPVYLNAISGKGVHVVTVNDYLAKRDAAWMGQVYNFLGLTVGCITHDLKDENRKAAYQADITYGTNNEFGFDYLRDNMKYRDDAIVQRPFNFAIVDEVDSILVDEARTPLIISGPAEDAAEMYIAVNRLIPKLIAEDFELDEKQRNVSLSEAGQEHIDQLLRESGLLLEGHLYDAHNIGLVHHVNQALRAHKLFSLDKDYIVKDDKVVIIDEFTGRMMEGRRYSEGLHQALEAKEGVKIQNENQTLASITFQNYFRLYPKLAGMTGTAMTEAAEFMEIYRLAVVEIPTNRAITRIDHNDKIYKSLREKEDAVIEVIRDCMARKQPVLVGTVSIEKSESLAKRLEQAKIPHNVLNARYHEQEAHIVAQAGRPGAVTIATNMAGRGTDIQLGGNLEMRVEREIPADLTEVEREKRIELIKAEIARDREIVREAGGLYIVGTERHESRRIDNQLRGRSGRQGDPGASIFFLSLDDDLMRIFGAEKMEALLGNKTIGLREGEALVHPWISKALERAQARVEAMNFEIRKNLLKFDNVMNDQRKVIYEQRREIMAADSIEELVTDMRHEVIEEMVAKFMPEHSYADQWDTAGLKGEILRVLALQLPIEDWAKEEGIADAEITKRIIDESDRKMAGKAANAGPKTFRQMEKAFILQLLDQHWKEHLLNLDHLRQGINLRAYGQRDPLNEYKSEAFAMFELLLLHLRESVTQTLSLLDMSSPEGMEDAFLGRGPDQSKMQETRTDPAMMGTGVGAAPETSSAAPVRNVAFDPADSRTWSNVPRNAECPCGSGKKFKQCHGKIE